MNITGAILMEYLKYAALGFCIGMLLVAFFATYNDARNDRNDNGRGY